MCVTCRRLECHGVVLLDLNHWFLSWTGQSILRLRRLQNWYCVLNFLSKNKTLCLVLCTLGAPSFPMLLPGRNSCKPYPAGLLFPYIPLPLPHISFTIFSPYPLPPLPSLPWLAMPSHPLLFPPSTFSFYPLSYWVPSLPCVPFPSYFNILSAFSFLFSCPFQTKCKWLKVSQDEEWRQEQDENKEVISKKKKVVTWKLLLICIVFPVFGHFSKAPGNYDHMAVPTP